jgi:hypothetical protein
VICWHPRNRTPGPISSSADNSACARPFQLGQFGSGVNFIPDAEDPADHLFGPGFINPLGFTVQQFYFAFLTVKSWRVQSTFPDGPYDEIDPVRMQPGGVFGVTIPVQSDMLAVGGFFGGLDSRFGVFFHRGKLFPRFGFVDLFVGGDVQGHATSTPPSPSTPPPETGALKIMGLSTPLYALGFSVPQSGDITWTPETFW